MVNLIDQQPATSDLIVGSAANAALEASVGPVLQQSNEASPITTLGSLSCELLPVVLITSTARDTPIDFATGAENYRVMASKAKNL